MFVLTTTIFTVQLRSVSTCVRPTQRAIDRYNLVKIWSALLLELINCTFWDFWNAAIQFRNRLGRHLSLLLVFLIAAIINSSTLIYKLTTALMDNWERFLKWCEKYVWQLKFRMDYAFFVASSCRCVLLKLHKFLPKFWTMVGSIHNGVFLFVRFLLTVCVMYWTRVEDYFYPFHEVCNASIVRDGSGFTKTEITSTESFGSRTLMNETGFEI